MSPVKIIAIIMLVSFMLQIGVQVNIEHLLDALKNYGLLGRAFLVNFILIPLFGVILVWVFRLDPMIATGILLMSMAPGVPLLPRAAGRARGGSLGFALCLAFLMPALSTITVPITASLILPAGAARNVHFGSFLLNLVLFQLIPLIIGMIVARRAPALAEKLVRPLGILFLVSVIALLAAISPVIFKAFAAVIGSRGVLTSAILVLLSLVTGWLFAGPDTSYRRTLSISTAMRNIALASLVASANFPGTTATATAVCYFIVALILTTLVGTLYSRRSAAPPPQPSPTPS